jgi:hypothetical protein
VDYFAPQLYWAIAPPDQSFPVLLKWWQQQNPRHRNIWPGLDSERVGGKWKASEIVNQIKITREYCDGAAGAIHWSERCLMQDHGGLATELANGVYAEPALVPPSSWLENKFPGKPKLKINANGVLNWQPAAFDKISAWVLQSKIGNSWETKILPGDTRHESLTGAPEIVALTAIDRCGVASPSATFQKSDSPAK